MGSKEGVMVGFFAGVILMACLHGLLLASIFLFYKKLNAKSNRFLALSILGVCVILGYEFFYWLDAEAQIPLWIQYLPLYIRTTIPAGIFYFVVFLIQPNHHLSSFEKMGFVAIGLEVVLEMAHIPVNLLIESPEKIAVIENYIAILGWLLSIIVAVAFLPLALHKVNRYQKFLYDHYSTTNGKSLAWLRIFLLLVLLMMVLGIISFVQYVLEYWEACEFTFGIVTIGLVVLLFWVGYSIILKYTWFEVVPFTEQETAKEAPENKLSEKTNAYHQSLLALIQDKKIYEDPELTLQHLSEHLQISPGYLSQIINEKEEKTFFEFINSYRIEAVKAKLLDEKYHNYTIMGIAMESGFKSKSTFNAVFKKFTGLTPTAFKKTHR